MWDNAARFRQGCCGLTPHQLRMARAALGWSIADLTHHAGVSISTVQRIERLSSVPRNDLLSSLELITV
jgi:ribosome-binding protein aMBF1 (putative translation factor)